MRSLWLVVLALGCGPVVDGGPEVAGSDGTDARSESPVPVGSTSTGVASGPPPTLSSSTGAPPGLMTTYNGPDSSSSSSDGSSADAEESGSSTAAPPVDCVDQPDVESCADAGCHVTSGRRWTSTDEGGTCKEPEQLLSCTAPVACLMPAYACSLVAQPYLLIEMIQGCLPEDHYECDPPAFEPPDCP